MEQQLVIFHVIEDKHRDKYIRNYEVLTFPLSDLRPEVELKLWGTRKMQVLGMTDEELAFKIGDLRRYTLNRYWQVLSTVKMDLEDPFDDRSERFILYFSTPVEKAADGVYNRMTELIGTMRENGKTGDFWKNIPLGREMMHLFKDCVPLRDEEINPVVGMKAMSALAGEWLLSKQDVPRLFLSFYAYWEVCDQLKEKEDGSPNGTESFAEAWNDNLFKFTWMVDPCMTAELFDKLFGNDTTLRFDFLQLSPEWEKEVYDIELETDEAVKGESRGMGFCFSYWMSKAATAKRHGLLWRSPHVMNPGVMFD